MAQSPGRHLSSSGQPVPRGSLARNEHETSVRHSSPVPGQPGFTLTLPWLRAHDLSCRALPAPCQVLNRTLLFVRRVGVVPNPHPVLAPQRLCFDSGRDIDAWGFFCCCFVLKDVAPPAIEFPRAFPVVSSPNTACTARHCLSVPFTYPHTSSLRGSRFPLSFYSPGTRRALSAPGVFQHKQLPPPVPTVETAEISRFSTSGT